MTRLTSVRSGTRSALAYRRRSPSQVQASALVFRASISPRSLPGIFAICNCTHVAISQKHQSQSMMAKLACA